MKKTKSPEALIAQAQRLLEKIRRHHVKLSATLEKVQKETPFDLKAIARLKVKKCWAKTLLQTGQIRLERFMIDCWQKQVFGYSHWSPPVADPSTEGWGCDWDGHRPQSTGDASVAGTGQHMTGGGGVVTPRQRQAAAPAV